LGEIDLGLDFIAASGTGARRFARRMRFATAAEISAHLFGFMVFKRTGVGFLLGDTHLCQRIENCFALNFQLSGQIVDSNLAHPPFRPPKLSR
jgi:hypothetical protein